MNNYLLFITIVVNFVCILLAYKLFGKIGLYAWIALSSVIANIEVVKCVDIFGLSVTLGNVIYGSTFLATDMLSEFYGGKQARKGVAIGFFAMAVFTVTSQINLLYEPNAQDYASGAMKVLFSLTPRLCAASLIAFLISNTLDTYSYEWFKKLFPKALWVRNNASTMTSQLVDSFLFTFLAFAGVFAMPELVELSLTTYVIKVVIAACDTPFLYMAKRLHQTEVNPVGE